MEVKIMSDDIVCRSSQQFTLMFLLRLTPYHYSKLKDSRTMIRPTKPLLRRPLQLFFIFGVAQPNVPLLIHLPTLVIRTGRHNDQRSDPSRWRSTCIVGVIVCPRTANFDSCLLCLADDSSGGRIPSFFSHRLLDVRLETYAPTPAAFFK